MSEQKTQLRKQLLQRTGELSPPYITAASEKITAAVLSSALYLDARAIFVYVSTPREPDTRAILADAWRRGKTVYVPKCRKKPHMDAIRIAGFDDLTPGTLGILEPKDGMPAEETPALDLVIVPCVSASRDGRRLGHGAAYYDTFLSRMQVPTMCLCFAELLCDGIPMTAHDVWMDQVITEDGITNCRKLPL